jgi:NitT/TauT family transport system ATP-binding protein
MEAIRLSDKILLLEPDPGRIVKTFRFDLPQAERTDAWVYAQTAQLLNDPDVIETFELELR